MATEPSKEAAARRREVGQRIRALRRSLALSQESFAERLDVERNTVSRWELGEHEPRHEQLRRICSTFGAALNQFTAVASDSDVDRRDFLQKLAGLSVGALAGVDPAWRLADVERLQSSILGQVVDQAVVEHLEEITRQHTYLYFRLGTWDMLEAIQGHLRATMLIGQGTVPEQLRQRLAGIVTHEAGHAAWLSYDLGRSSASEQFYAVADDAASRADPSLAAYVKAYKSNVRISRGQIREGLALAEEASAQGRDAEPSIQAWLAAMEAQAAAAAQNRDRVEAALKRAEAKLDVAWGRPGARLFWLDPWRLSAIAGACYERLGYAREAERQFQPALEHLPQRSPRGRSEMQLDLAGVALLQHDIPRACELVRASLEAAQAAGSEASLDRIRQFRVRLHNWRREAAVAELDHHLSLM
jgi:transcriptional regulator with XRE-family HTH domain/tetratricopeptide (TPR) repeat protein